MAKAYFTKEAKKPERKPVTLELDADEALVVRSLIGIVTGAGPLRDASDRVWKAFRVLDGYTTPQNWKYNDAYITFEGEDA